LTDNSAAYIRLQGVEAKEHPVFAELSRVKNYFEKIKLAQSVESVRPTMRIDKNAVGRILKYDLVGGTKQVSGFAH